MTNKTFYENAYQFSFKGTVLSCQEGKGGWEVVLDKTAFYPEGGGQPADIGTLGDTFVLDAHERHEQVVHLTDRPLKVGAYVSGEVDHVRRLELMRHHTGEHMVSGLLNRLYGLHNIGFHMGRELVTMDFDGVLDKDAWDEVERLANEGVWRNLPVTTSYPVAEALETINYRSKKALEGAVRIVEVQEYDCCACCGLHVSHTGEIGAIKLLAPQNYKGGTRISLVCGSRALLDYGKKNHAVSEISTLLSVKPGEVSTGVKRMIEENAVLKVRQTALENRLFVQIARSAEPQGEVLCIFEEGLLPDALRRLCIALSEKCRLAAVFSGADGLFQYALGSPEMDVRPIGKQLNETCCGRGGGKSGLIQGSVNASRQTIEEWMGQAL